MRKIKAELMPSSYLYRLPTLLRVIDVFYQIGQMILKPLGGLHVISRTTMENSNWSPDRNVQILSQELFSLPFWGHFQNKMYNFCLKENLTATSPKKCTLLRKVKWTWVTLNYNFAIRKFTLGPYILHFTLKTHLFAVFVLRQKKAPFFCLSTNRANRCQNYSYSEEKKQSDLYFLCIYICWHNQQKRWRAEYRGTNLTRT